MKYNVTLKISGGIIWCLFLFSGILNGQRYSFKNFDSESTIPNGFIYTIDQSDDGFLWVGTGNGLYRFDGINFFNVQYPDSSAGRYPTASLKDRSGTLWFGFSDGSVFYVRENNLIPVPISNSKSISSILEAADHMIYVIPQGKAVYSINKTRPQEIHKYPISNDPVMLSAACTSQGSLLIGTQENLMICSLGKDSVMVKQVIEGFGYSSITSIHNTTDSSRFLIGTDGNGLFMLRISDKSNSLSRISDKPEWESLSIKTIMHDLDNSFWVSTFGNGVIQVCFSDDYESVKSVHNYNINSGLTSNDIKTVYQDIEGNYWIGLAGNGISMLASNAFGYYVPGKSREENNVIYICSSGDKYILGTPAGIHLFDDTEGKSLSFTDFSGQTGKAEITSYNLDEDNNLWIGTGGKGLYVRKSSGKVSLFYKSGDSGADFINDIGTDSQNIWLATTNGVVVLDRNTGKNKKKFDISNGLPHNSINKLLVARDGNVYIGTESDRLYMIDKGFNIIAGKGIMIGSTLNKILSFSQSADGSIWVATKGNGIFRCNNDSASVISRSNGLMSNYCYSLLADSESYVWIGHEKGFSRLNTNKGTVRIFGTDFAKGGVCNPGSMFESADRKILIGTTEGLIIYDRQKDITREVAPFTNINYITINDVKYDYRPSFSLPYNKKYIIRVGYIGINFGDPGKVYYSTYVENFDEDWSKMTTSREASYSLTYGKYRFNLLSVNENGLSNDPPVSFDIFIRRPFWMTWWFTLSAFSLAIVVVILIIRQREKAQRKIQEYLEEELELRTSVIRKQKGEIELQNIEITDSINYAKRIQTSILPDIKKLKESFEDAFIFFHPRDIVSGDFYWFNKIGDDKFLLVCADSTGHGVPGAFMSLIGSTLLQDIVASKRISRPSEILGLLDKQIFATLNQNMEFGVSNDGMDVVVCEISINTRHIRFASAMRPVIIVMDGDPVYIKGNRYSVGGESVMEKFFDDQEYYLREGDTIYLFSDGFPDQFGGPDGKKMKINRLKRMIEQVSKLPMDQQKEALSKYYFDWKGEFDQVDDVLLIGVKI